MRESRLFTLPSHMNTMITARAADFLLSVVERPGQAFVHTPRTPAEGLAARTIAEASHGLVVMGKKGPLTTFTCPLMRACADELMMPDGAHATDAVFAAYQNNALARLRTANPGDMDVWFSEPTCQALKEDWKAYVIDDFAARHVWKDGQRLEGTV